MGDLKDWALGVASKVSKVGVTERQVGDVAVVSVAGSIVTDGSADRVREIIRRLLSEGRRKILLDMEQVRWVDSAGIGTLVSALLSVAREGGQLKLLKVRGNIKELLSVTKVLALFSVHEDESEALNDFR